LEPATQPRQVKLTDSLAVTTHGTLLCGECGFGGDFSLIKSRNKKN
jgi:hypothetical protein